MLGKHASKSFVRRQLKVKGGGDWGHRVQSYGEGLNWFQNSLWLNISPNLQI